MDSYFVKKGYKVREKNQYYDDFTGTTIWQPDVYSAAIYLARNSGAEYIVDIGSGNGEKLLPYKKEFKFVFIDFGKNLDIIKKKFGHDNTYINQNFEKTFPVVNENILAKAVVICSDVVEHIVKPEKLVRGLVEMQKKAQWLVVSTPDRLRTRGVESMGPPENKTHVREWSMEELDSFFRSCGSVSHLIGITRSNDYEQVRRTSIIIGGTFITRLRETSDVAQVSVIAQYKDKAFAEDYYYAQCTLVNQDVLSKIVLRKDEWLVSPNMNMRVGSILSHATQNGYTHINIQRLSLFTTSEMNFPRAGLLRQSHGLVAMNNDAREVQIGSGDKRVYPINLYSFREVNRLDIAKLQKKDYDVHPLFDIGHISDEYIVESLFGWRVRKGNF